jgi:uncharacterized membrane protein HdeD (DUF308 family)
MRQHKKRNQDDKVIVSFKWAKLNKNEANQTGIAIFSGIIGIILSLIIFGKDQKFYSLIMVGIFTGIGFFGYRLFKR